MSDLNLTITEEEQSILEEKLAAIMGGGIINSYGSVSSEIVSVLLTAQQKPLNIEEMLATQEIYGNAVKKLFGIDQSIIDIEKMKAYQNVKNIVNQFEKSMEKQAENTQIPEDMKDAPVEDADTTDVESAVEKIAGATEMLKESAEKATASMKKSPAKKSTRTSSRKKN